MDIPRANHLFSTTLSQAIDEVQTVLYPNALPPIVPCILTLEPKSDKEEKVKVLSKGSGQITVERGYGDTVAIEHSVGATIADYNAPDYLNEMADAVEAAVEAVDNAVEQLESAAESMVTLDDEQALTNKDLSDPSNTFPSFEVPSDGWISTEEEWTYGTADSPTFTFTIDGDLTGKYSPGMRVKLTQSTGGTKYFIITRVQHSAGTTTITVYGGTDYTLNDEAIDAPHFSTQKAPHGFPLDPAKWTVEVVNTTNVSQSSPTVGTWYNLGSIALDIPIGVWKVGYQALFSFTAGGINNLGQIRATLSTANNSESHNARTSEIAVQTTSTSSLRLSITKDFPIALTSKTPHYLNAVVINGTMSGINFRGNDTPTTVRAVSAYL